MPEALEVPLKEPPYSFSTAEYNYLYVFSFVPIVLFDIPLGMLMDRIPLRYTMMTMAILLFFSQTFIGVAMQFMIPGYVAVSCGMRSIFGITGEGMFNCAIMIIS
jgi:hypothetical protein